MEWMKASIAPDWHAMIVQLIATIIFAWGVKKLLWVHIVEYAKKRRDYIKSQYDDAENLKRESENFILDAEAKKNEIYSESKAIISRAKKDGEDIKSKAIEDARFEANRKIERAEDEISLAKEQANEEIKMRSAELATVIATKLIVKNVSNLDQENLISEALEEIK